jgi:hypothetical protein
VTPAGSGYKGESIHQRGLASRTVAHERHVANRIRAIGFQGASFDGGDSEIVRRGRGDVKWRRMGQAENRSNGPTAGIIPIFLTPEYLTTPAPASRGSTAGPQQLASTRPRSPQPWPLRRPPTSAGRPTWPSR